MKPINILIADAAFLVRMGIKAVLSGYPHLRVMEEATNGSELRQLMDTKRPDVVILDYNAPGVFDLEDVQHLSERAPESGILVISSDLKRQDVLQVLEWGVKGFLLKECDQSEIVSAISSVARKEKFFCGKVLDIILERRTQSAPGSGEACQPTRLTERETEIVKLMAEGYATQDIAENLSLSVHTIYTHRKNIMRKLGVTTAAEVILYAFNTSLVTA
jgi:two-component system, NarL family, invasion response regulator UvrY